MAKATRGLPSYPGRVPPIARNGTRRFVAFMPRASNPPPWRIRGAGRVDELLGRCPETLALVDPETGEPLAGDEVVRMAEIVDATRTVYEWAADDAERSGDDATRAMIADAFPDTLPKARTWLAWGGAIPETDDPEARRSWAESSPGLPANLERQRYQHLPTAEAQPCWPSSRCSQSC